MTVQPTRDQLRALADAATPGPWEYPGTLLGLSCTTVFAGRTHAAYVAAASPDDGAFIAAARTALPQLLVQFDQAEAERDEWRQTALDEQGAALDLLEVIKDRDQRIERVRGLMNHNDNIDNVPIDDLLHALDGDA